MKEGCVSIAPQDASASQGACSTDGTLLLCECGEKYTTVVFGIAEGLEGTILTNVRIYFKRREY